MNYSSAKIITPCIGVCSTGIGDLVCRGCKRFAHEIIEWNGYEPEQRLAVLERLDDFLAKIISRKCTVIAPAKLLQTLEYQNITVRQEQSAWSQVFLLLRAGAGQLKSLTDYGVELNVEWQNRPLVELKQAIESEFMDLSEAYYQRFIESYY